MKCLYLSDNDGSGAMEVYGHPTAVRFAESSQMFTDVNRTFITRKYVYESEAQPRPARLKNVCNKVGS